MFHSLPSLFCQVVVFVAFVGAIGETHLHRRRIYCDLFSSPVASKGIRRMPWPLGVLGAFHLLCTLVAARPSSWVCTQSIPHKTLFLLQGCCKENGEWQSLEVTTASPFYAAIISGHRVPTASLCSILPCQPMCVLSCCHKTFLLCKQF